jgi:hypothetical protein
MDNWVVQILLLVASFILGIVANLITPSIKTFIKNWSLSLRERKIERIKEEYEDLINFKEDSTLLIIEIIRKLSVPMSYLFFFILASNFVNVYVNYGNFNKLEIFIIYAMLGVFAGYSSFMLFRISILIIDVKHFQAKRYEMIKQLEKLGATLDEESELDTNSVSGD